MSLYGLCLSLSTLFNWGICVLQFKAPFGDGFHFQILSRNLVNVRSDKKNDLSSFCLAKLKVTFTLHISLLPQLFSQFFKFPHTKCVHRKFCDICIVSYACSYFSSNSSMWFFFPCLLLDSNSGIPRRSFRKCAFEFQWWARTDPETVDKCTCFKAYCNVPHGISQRKTTASSSDTRERKGEMIISATIHIL